MELLLFNSMMFGAFLFMIVTSGFIIFLVSLPYIISLQAEGIPVWFLGIGLTTYRPGLTIEITADVELDAFIARKKPALSRQYSLLPDFFATVASPTTLVRHYFGED